VSNKTHPPATRAEVKRLLLIRKVDPDAPEAKTKSIMRATRTSRSHVQYIARELGVNRPQGIRKVKMLEPATQAAILADRAAGMTIRALEDKYNARYEDVRKIINANPDDQPRAQKVTFNWAGEVASRYEAQGLRECAAHYRKLEAR
jgi:hypothetical protein